MHDEGSFHGSPRADGAGDRWLAAAVTVLVVAFIGLALVKPWGGTAQPTPPVSLASATVTPPASLRTTAPEVRSAAPSSHAGPLPVAFTTPRPPSASAAWSGLRWRRLAPDDPLNLVTSVLRWSGGFIAVGWVPRLPATPVWTSTDGKRWEPLLFGTATTFWPGLAVLGVADTPRGLVAVTESMEFCGEPCTSPFVPPVISWTSADGRRWAPHLILPPEWLANPPGSPPLVAVGPAGLVVASTGPAAHLATSTDGTHWQLLPAARFPARFALNDLRGTATGYVAVGHWTSDNPGDAASLWSSDGRHWPATPTLLPTAPFAGAAVGSAVGSLAIGRDGMVAIGRGVTAAEANLWWQSPDGRHWRALTTFSPVGQAPCANEACRQQPGGALVGDGQRLVAVRGGPNPVAWVSSDGGSWRPVSMSGDLPSGGATDATLLPGGVLVSDGSTTWYGEAVAH